MKITDQVVLSNVLKFFDGILFKNFKIKVVYYVDGEWDIYRIEGVELFRMRYIIEGDQISVTYMLAGNEERSIKKFINTGAGDHNGLEYWWNALTSSSKIADKIAEAVSSISNKI